MSDPEGVGQLRAEDLGASTHIKEEGGDEATLPAGKKRVRRRWRRGALLVFVLLIALTGSTGIGAFLGSHHRDGEVARLQALANHNQAGWQDALSQLYGTKSDLADLQGKVQDAVGDINHPTFVTWSAPTRLSRGGFLVASVPDTFTFKAELKSTAPIKLMIMTVQDFACWRTRVCPSHWVEWSSVYGLGAVLDVRDLVPAHRISAVFHKAEGCAAYVAVITGSGRVVPQVTAIRHPASHPTGVCA